MLTPCSLCQHPLPPVLVPASRTAPPRPVPLPQLPRAPRTWPCTWASLRWPCACCCCCSSSSSFTAARSRGWTQTWPTPPSSPQASSLSASSPAKQVCCLCPQHSCPGPHARGHSQCHSLNLSLPYRQSPSAHHPARPQHHHHHHLPGQPMSPAGWAQPQVSADQWAPAQPTEWRPPHAAPQLAHLRGRGLRLPPVHPELLPLPAARRQQHGLRDLQLPRGPADDPSYGWEGPQSSPGSSKRRQ